MRRLRLREVEQVEVQEADCEYRGRKVVASSFQSRSGKEADAAAFKDSSRFFEA
jgi:hypothetical protein